MFRQRNQYIHLLNTTKINVIGTTAFPGIIGVIAPNSVDYADFTFDGANADIDVQNGDLNFRPLTSGKNVNVFGTASNVKLRVGNQNFSQALDMLHDGTNATISTTSGQLILAPAGAISFNGAQIIKRTATAISYTALSTDFLIGVTSTASARTITLPAAATATAGALYMVKDESGAAGTNNITIDPNASETIDGALTKIINTNYGSLTFYTDGTSWFSIS